MAEAIVNILTTLGWLGIVLIILGAVNITCKAFHNIGSGKENFSWRKLIKGLIKLTLFYTGTAGCSVAFTMLPFINTMIVNNFDVVLFSNDVLETLSTVGVLGIVTSTIIIQGKLALESIVKLSEKEAEVENSGTDNL